MKVLFFSRETVKRILPIGENGHIAVISVNDDIDEQEEMLCLLEDNLDIFHTTVFHDTCYADSGFTEQTAKAIIDFINACHHNPNIKMIWVHCLMGVSRSAAIAKFINTYLGLGIIELDDYCMHNMYVYEILCKEAGIQTLKEYYSALEHMRADDEE